MTSQIVRETSKTDTKSGAAGSSAPANATAEEMIDDEEFVGNKLGLGFWLSLAWIVVVSVAAFLAPWLPLRPVTGPELSLIHI